MTLFQAFEKISIYQKILGCCMYQVNYVSKRLATGMHPWQRAFMCHVCTYLALITWLRNKISLLLLCTRPPYGL